MNYTKNRNAFGKPLFGMQNTRFELAECATVARIARVFVDDCIQRHLRGELDATTASMAKAWVTDTQVQVIDRCVQLFGGYGYMMEYPIARTFIDSRAAATVSEGGVVFPRGCGSSFVVFGVAFQDAARINDVLQQLSRWGEAVRRGRRRRTAWFRWIRKEWCRQPQRFRTRWTDRTFVTR